MFRRKRSLEDFGAEAESHLQLEVDRLLEQGLSEEEARAAAHRAFGNLTLVQERFYESGHWLWWDSLVQDMRFGLRMLRSNLGFSAVIILTLAIGIGANTAIFSVIHAVLLRPLPFPEPDRLVFLSEATADIPEMYFSMADLADWRAMNTVFTAIGSYRRDTFDLAGRGAPQRLNAREVSAEFLSTVGIKPLLGRFLTAEEDRVESPRVAVLGESFWVREFARDPRVLDMQLKLNGEAFTVIGVVPDRGLHLILQSDVDVYTSLGRLEDRIGGPAHRDDHRGIYAVARLEPGVSVEKARSEMTAIAAKLAQRYPKTNLGITSVVMPLLYQEVGDVQLPLLLLSGAVGLILLIGCANVANMLTSLAVVRRQEIAIRSALGAGGGRLARQFLCESILLALLGGAAGLVVAYGSTAAVSAALPHLPSRMAPRFDEIATDRSVLLFSLAISLLAGVSFGVFPALAAYRADPNELLKENNRTTGTSLGHMRVRGLLVTAELALCVVLLVAAGLMIKSLFHVLQGDHGFQSDGVLTAALDLSPAKYNDPAPRIELVHHFLGKVAALPGVQAVGFKSPVLLAPFEMPFSVDGRPKPKAGEEPLTEASAVTAGFLEAMRIRLLKGRSISPADDEGSTKVCVVDDLLARQYWPGESAIGKHVTIELSAEPGHQLFSASIVGVIHHVENGIAGVPTLPEIYIPYGQYPNRSGSLVVLSQTDPSALVPSVRSALHSVDPSLTLSSFETLQDIVKTRVSPRKLSVLLLSCLAVIALVLATLGTYGVIAYMVTGRTQEIGLRRALGATPQQILRLILVQGMRLALWGVLTGVVAALVMGRLVSPILSGVTARDPLTFVIVGGLLLFVSFIACYVPARRAVQLRPLAAVRHE
jgi:predicted permease